MEQSLTATRGWTASRVIAFGFLATFMSSFGQTFFLGLFNPYFQQAVGIGGARLGLLYGAATLVSGMLLFWLGGALDRISLPRATSITIALFVTGCLLAGTTTTQIQLLAAFFLLRLGGQGLLTHLAIVAAARAGGERKGSTIAWASMGVILGEAVLPAAVVAAFALLQWRWMWGGTAALLAVVVLPALLLLGRELPWRAVSQEPEAASAAGSIEQRRVLLRRPAYWAASSLLLAPPFMATAFLFEQATFARQMHWEPGLIGAAFAVFALCRGLGTWGYGRAADRFGVVSMLRMHLLPMALAFASLSVPLGQASIWVAFAGVGFTNGANSVLGGAVWVELFGVASVGLVRGVFTACMVVASAMAPAVVASLLSMDVSAVDIGLAFAAYSAITPLLVGPVLHGRRRDR
ncbi:MAG TPA: MFS transporter [Gammaproteobacteria bacterium]|nr:MFS transporter [Gammaproteobacteria bacterium]